MRRERREGFASGWVEASGWVKRFTIMGFLEVRFDVANFE